MAVLSGHVDRDKSVPQRVESLQNPSATRAIFLREFREGLGDSLRRLIAENPACGRALFERKQP